MARYYVLKDGQQFGPYEVRVVLGKIKEGSIQTSDKCLLEGEAQWNLIESAFPKFVLDQILTGVQKETMDSDSICSDLKDGKDSSAAKAELIDQETAKGVSWIKAFTVGLPVGIVLLLVADFLIDYMGSIGLAFISGLLIVAVGFLLKRV